MRSIVNAMFYMMRTGCQWWRLPREFPPFTTVQHYFYAWRDSGVLERINFELLLRARETAGREPSPSARDCQEFRAEVGHDRGKGAQRCRDAKTVAYPTLSSTICWLAPTRRRFSTLTGCSTI
jgi:transposase